MKDKLTISSELEHDGDGIVRFRIRAENADFRGSTLAWGNAIDAGNLGELLKGFPKGTPASLEYAFGSPKTGQCQLRFQTIDSVGNCCVWATIESAYTSAGTERFQSAFVCVRFLPANLDEFCTQLTRFKRGRDNEAVLGRTL
jgi:hypothetical protein